MPPTRFHRVLVPAGPEIVEPRDTVGKRVLGKRGADAVVAALVQSPFGAAFNAVISITAVTCGTLGVIGLVAPDYAWGAMFAFPGIVSILSPLNVHMLGAILRSFDFLIILGLSVVWVVCVADSVREEPPRVAACVVALFASMTGSCFDALPLLKPTASRHSMVMRVALYIMLALMEGFILIIYYTGNLKRVTPRIIPLNYDDVNMSINVLQVGMSAMQVTLIFTLRTLVVQISSPRGKNRMVALRGAIEYAVIDDVADESPSPVVAP